ncbi:MAG: HlyD family secretion protein [Parachlamydiales bacterium]
MSIDRPKTLAISLSALVIIGVAVGLFFFEWRRVVWTNDANIEAYQTNLTSNVTERILSLYVDEGDTVREGQLIAQLQNNVPLAQKAEAEANIIRLQQEIKVKEALLEKVRNDYIRAEEGIGDRVISAQDFDHKQKDFWMAEAGLALSIAALEQAVRQLEVIEAQLVHYTIHAPRDGVIAKRWVWVGDVVSPGQALYTMYDLQDVWVLANLEEFKMENIRLGDPVDIRVDAYPGYRFHGEIFTIKGAAASQFSLVPQNNATGNYTKVAQRVPLKISIRPPDDFPKGEPLYLFPGLSCEVLIKVKPLATSSCGPQDKELTCPLDGPSLSS